MINNDPASLGPGDIGFGNPNLDVQGRKRGYEQARTDYTQTRPLLDTSPANVTRQALTRLPQHLQVTGQAYMVMMAVLPPIKRGQKQRQGQCRCVMMPCGSFATEQEAIAHAGKVHDACQGIWDVNVVEMYGWLPMPPSQENLDNVHSRQADVEDVLRLGMMASNDSSQAFMDRLQQGKDSSARHKALLDAHKAQVEAQQQQPLAIQDSDDMDQ